MERQKNFSPRARGIREHLERARFLVELARNQADEKARYRLMLAAVYSCYAITNIMWDAAEKHEVIGLNDLEEKKNKSELNGCIAPMLPYYALIERIRIHDFHRHGIVPPDPTVREMTYRGPIKLKARKGLAAITVTQSGPQTHTTGDSTVEPQRPLLNDDGRFFDDESKSYVSLATILDAFLCKAPDAISAFEARLR
jgi:hypothetical protein